MCRQMFWANLKATPILKTPYIEHIVDKMQKSKINTMSKVDCEEEVCCQNNKKV